jgi:hypothetical protein
MFRRIATGMGILVLAASTLPADFSYQETTTITGGMAAAAMKIAGAFSKQAREPIQGTVAVKGDRMVRRTNLHITVTDLANQTITSIDMQKKTYSVMTFAEMKQAMEQMMEKMHQANANQPQVDFKVSAKSTGNAKQISGFDANEMLIRMEMEGTDQQSGQKGSMVVTTNVWIAPAAPGYNEVREFHRRMAEKLGWTPNSNPMMSRPDIAKGMTEAAKEIAKLDGMPVQQTMTMGMDVPPGAAQSGDTSQQPAAQQQPQQQPPAERPSLSGGLGGLLAGRLAKKKSDQSASQGSQGSSSGNPGSIIDMQMDFSGFSSGAVDDSQFAIPAGFKQVESPMKKNM